MIPQRVVKHCIATKYMLVYVVIYATYRNFDFHF